MLLPETEQRKKTASTIIVDAKRSISFQRGWSTYTYVVIHTELLYTDDTNTHAYNAHAERARERARVVSRRATVNNIFT